MNRSATASIHSATPKKNAPCFSDVVVKFFLKKERTFFFGVLPSRSRAGGWANADSDGTAGGGWGEECRAVIAFNCGKWLSTERVLTFI